MYTPLELMTQIENMVIVMGNGKLRKRVNEVMIKSSKSFWSSDRAEKFLKNKIMWNKMKNNFADMFDDFSDDISKYAKYYTNRTGMVVMSMLDFTFQNHLYLIRNDWIKNKRVYKIDNNIMRELCEMKNPARIPLAALYRLPNKCFYIDYNGVCPFCDKAVGSFVTYDVHGNTLLWSLTHLIEGKRIYCLCTDFAYSFSESDAENLDSMEASIQLGLFAGEDTEVEIEDGSAAVINDRKCVQFFINFCLYLYASNNDVEYTEKTKKNYKKSSEKKSIHSIEEFGVGFRNGLKVSSTTKRVRYVGGEPTKHNEIKRGYSSHYRSAHWHHYWVKDNDNPGSKKLTVKWVEGTFVQGNKSSDSVIVHKVTN